MRISCLEGYFVDFSQARDLSGFFFKTQGSGCKILDPELITQKSRDLFARSLN
jgi:hypothetical protein